MLDIPVPLGSIPVISLNIEHVLPAYVKAWQHGTWPGHVLPLFNLQASQHAEMLAVVTFSVIDPFQFLFSGAPQVGPEGALPLGVYDHALNLACRQHSS